MRQEQTGGASTLAPDPPKVRIVDCDVHTSIPVDALHARLPERWRDYHRDYGLRYPKPNAFFPTRPRRFASRADAWPPTGGRPGSDMPFLREQLLDTWGVDYAILNSVGAVDFGSQYPEFAAELTRALNDWTTEEWLDKDERFLGAVTVPIEDGRLAAAEIDRVAGDKRWVHVVLGCRTREPLGDRKYWPMYEAACAHGLPICMHVGGMGNNSVTGAGFPAYYLEDHVGLAHAVQTQVISLISQGTFERFPDLRFVCEEAGVTWSLSMMWALDNAWSLLRDEMRHLPRLPSEYLREHFWFTTQPIEEPDDPDELVAVLDELDMYEHIMFATDYPHWDFDAPTSALPRSLPEDVKQAIFSGNACRFYGLSL